jgi:hypothetical protein
MDSTNDSWVLVDDPNEWVIVDNAHRINLRMDLGTEVADFVGNTITTPTTPPAQNQMEWDEFM